MSSHPDLSVGLRPTGEVLDKTTKYTDNTQCNRSSPVAERCASPGFTGVLPAGSFNYAPRVRAVAAAFGFPDPCNLSDGDRRRLIAAIFDPRVAPASQEQWDA